MTGHRKTRDTNAHPCPQSAGHKEHGYRNWKNRIVILRHKVDIANGGYGQIPRRSDTVNLIVLQHANQRDNPARQRHCTRNFFDVIRASHSVQHQNSEQKKTDLSKENVQALIDITRPKQRSQTDCQQPQKHKVQRRIDYRHFAI